MLLQPAVAAGDDYVTRVTDAPPPDPSRVWEEAGFRVQVMLGYDRLDGFGDIPGGSGFLFGLQPGVQLSSLWEIDMAMRYSVLTTASLNGLRWAVTLGPTLHPVAGLGLSLGLGYAGMLADYPLAAAPSVGSSCNGSGGSLQGRLAYLIPVAEGFSTGPTLEAEVTGIRCAASVVGLNDDGSKKNGKLPFWWQHTVSLVWVAAWR